MAKKNQPDLLTVTQAADFLQVTRSAVWDAIKEQRISVAARYGRMVLISRDTLVAYKKKRRPGGPAPKKTTRS